VDWFHRDHIRGKRYCLQNNVVKIGDCVRYVTEGGSSLAERLYSSDDGQNSMVISGENLQTPSLIRGQFSLCVETDNFIEGEN
jgi:hypothetical protein